MCDTIYTIDDIKAVLHPVFVKHSVKKAVLFGSYVKGMANQNSDIDLLLDSGLRGLQFVGLIEDVRSALDKEVDVFDKTHIIPNSKISSEISKDGVVIYEK
ncbi:MAG: nucleotidyltransferase domain-containing protein [Ruminococcaceae bacterium]|nr:nucleotidyltransferase domain-containing protein [Oscillospiraceae bacterium]